MASQSSPNDSSFATEQREKALQKMKWVLDKMTPDDEMKFGADLFKLAKPKRFPTKDGTHAWILLFQLNHNLRKVISRLKREITVSALVGTQIITHLDEKKFVIAIGAPIQIVAQVCPGIVNIWTGNQIVENLLARFDNVISSQQWAIRVGSNTSDEFVGLTPKGFQTMTFADWSRYLTAQLTKELLVTAALPDSKLDKTTIPGLMNRVNWSIRKDSVEVSADEMTKRAAAIRARQGRGSTHEHGPNCDHGPDHHADEDVDDNIIGPISADDALDDEDLFGDLCHGSGPESDASDDNDDTISNDSVSDASDPSDSTGSDLGPGFPEPAEEVTSNVSALVNEIASLVLTG